MHYPEVHSTINHMGVGTLKTNAVKKKYEKAKFTDDSKFNPTEKKVDIRFDKDSLEMFIGYVFSNDPNISKMNLLHFHWIAEKSFQA